MTEIDRYADEALIERAKSSLAGVSREAEILLTIPRAIRPAIVQEAHYVMNHIGGRWSDNLQSAVSHLPSLTSPCAAAMYAEVTA